MNDESLFPKLQIHKSKFPKWNFQSEIFNLEFLNPTDQKAKFGSNKLQNKKTEILSQSDVIYIFVFWLLRKSESKAERIDGIPLNFHFQLTHPTNLEP